MSENYGESYTYSHADFRYSLFQLATIAKKTLESTNFLLLSVIAILLFPKWLGPRMR